MNHEYLFDLDSLKPSETSLPVLDEVAVIGGGRWGKITCQVLAQFQPRISKIHLVSRRNFKGINDWWNNESTTINKADSSRVSLWNSLDELINSSDFEAAFVTNLPAEHYETTKQLLKRGKHVLVTKPFVLDARQAEELIDLANERGLVLAVGLPYLMASYVRNFRQVMKQTLTSINHVEMLWHDVWEGQKWGMRKLPDLTTNVVTDLYPHIISLLSVLFGRQHINLTDLISHDGGLSARLSFCYGPYPVTLSLSRTATEPCRAIKLSSDDGHQLILDYTREPGGINLDGEDLAGDPYWNILPRPLPATFASFFREIQQRSSNTPLLARGTLYVVQASEAANSLMSRKQIELCRKHLLEAESDPPDEVVVALREHLLGPLLSNHLVDNPKDEEVIDHWGRLAFRLIHKLSNRPFVTQQEITEETGLSGDDLIRLNSALRVSDFVQELILKHGLGSKYWQNTIVPLIQSGAIEAVRKNEYRYPLRVGIYPGPSCMFYCTFCGRNYEAKYERGSVSTGNQGFMAMFREAPTDDPYRFYISGGLEPLTNPGIGEIARVGAERGFKLSMYTNGFMLTPTLLQRQDGLWDLDTLRISIYGADKRSAYEVTKREDAFDQVIVNAKRFLKLRNAKKSPMKFGFNFVILPGRAEHVLPLVEIIADINREAGGDRQVDFLTLREDYSVRETEAIQSTERERMIEVFAQLAKRTRKEDLCELQIDFGYALNPMKEGNLAKLLEMVDYQDMRKKGYPQVSVVMDLLGDVYLYREAGFLERPGARRYIIGRVSESRSLEIVVREFIESGHEIEAMPQDTQYFDIFDHVVTKLINQSESDEAFGVPFDKGPVRSRTYAPGSRQDGHGLVVAHPTLPTRDRRNP